MEAAGYIAGTITAAAQMVMPVRIWITLVASMALIIFAFCSESLLNISRALCIFTTLMSILIGSAVFRKGRLRFFDSAVMKTKQGEQEEAADRPPRRSFHNP
jgi:hypothetical protein